MFVVEKLKLLELLMSLILRQEKKSGLLQKTTFYLLKK